MQHFYDGQIRRYITQTIRVFSNFVVKYGDGTLHRVPVMYGDADRQVANILRGNSENKTNSVPRISVYVTALEMDKERLSDATYVGKMHIREREVLNGTYTQAQGRNYTIERLMPTPFKLTMKVDIWAANTDQKLQIMEQILVLFNPSLELQTSDNYADWTALSVLNLSNISWSSKTVPVGTDTAIDIGTFTVDTPIWISPPAKVKHLGVVTKIVANLFRSSAAGTTGYIDGLGIDLAEPGSASVSDQFGSQPVVVGGYVVHIQGGNAILLANGETANSSSLEINLPIGTRSSWQLLFDQYPGKYAAGSSQIYLMQSDGTEVAGTIAIDPMDDTLLSVNWDLDTVPQNTGIDSNGLMDSDVGYSVPAYRNGTSNNGGPGNFDAIINPQQTGPNDAKFVTRYGAISAGRRYLLIEDIGDADNTDGADAWKNSDNSDLVAKANDIIEWDGTQWNIIFDSVQESDTMVWQTNIYTGVQYLWNGVSWVKSYEGEYGIGQWRIVL